MKAPPTKITKLPPEQRAKVEEWIFQDGLTYAAISDLCQQHFGFSLSKDVLSSHRQGLEQKAMSDRALDAMTKRISGAAASANATVQIVEGLEAQFYAALKEQVGQKAFELAQKGEELPLKTLKDLTMIFSEGLRAEMGKRKADQKDEQLAQGRTALDQADRKIKLLEERENKTKAVITDASLSPEEKQKAVQQILGIS